MRNKILRSANSKYHYILPFFYKIYKGDLPLMYSSFFWSEFIEQVNFFGVAMIKNFASGQKSLWFNGFSSHKPSSSRQGKDCQSCFCAASLTLSYEWSDRGHTIEPKSWLNPWIHTKKHRYTLKVSLPYLFYRKKVKYNDI